MATFKEHTIWIKLCFHLKISCKDAKYIFVSSRSFPVWSLSFLKRANRYLFSSFINKVLINKYTTGPPPHPVDVLRLPKGVGDLIKVKGITGKTISFNFAIPSCLRVIGKKSHFNKTTTQDTLLNFVKITSNQNKGTTFLKSWPGRFNLLTFLPLDY